MTRIVISGASGDLARRVKGKTMKTTFRQQYSSKTEPPTTEHKIDYQR